ncbi:MAG TPA: glycosyltransferase family 4 protein [Rhizomicrobium sp.]|jgi:glycosyltransferase involved in cell wall biosynthesis|nr:glycosyltransferase family 4 protein [Rhizomicrobium sp.]
MRIAQIAPLDEAVPPHFYGGTERIVAYLCDSLVEMGHDVTLFASAESRTRAKLVKMRDQAIRLDKTELKSHLAAHLAMMHEVKSRQHEFDVLHFHTDVVHFPFFEDSADRTLTTLHGRLDLKDLPNALMRWPDYPLASISDSQRTPLPHANWAATVLHGLPMKQFRFSPAPQGGYLAFLGRVSPEKGPIRAIEIARAAGIPLKIAAKVDAHDEAYFHRHVEPLLNHELIDFIGEIGDEDKSDFLGNALALLFPIDWPEPFGLVMIEAMACGTPVIAWNCGAVPEIVDDGVTGFVVNSHEQALAAIGRLKLLNRLRIRHICERRFSAVAMAKRYLDVYVRLVGRSAYEHERMSAGISAV